MKKYLLLLPAVLILMGAGCNSQVVKPNGTNTGEVVASDDFSKKIECERFQNSVGKKIKEFNDAQKPEIRNSNNDPTGEPYNNLYVENNILKEVFYSPKVNSCLYLESKRTLVKRGEDAKPDVGPWGISYETYYLIDALSGKEIDFNQGVPFLQIIHRGELFTSEYDAYKIINEYR